MGLKKTAKGGAVPGDFIVDGGTLRLVAPGQIAGNSTVIITSGQVLIGNGVGNTIQDLTNNGGELSTGAGTLTVSKTTTTYLAGGTTTVNSGGTLNAAGLKVQDGVNTVEAGGTLIVGAGGAAFV